MYLVKFTLNSHLHINWGLKDKLLIMSYSTEIESCFNHSLSWQESGVYPVKSKTWSITVDLECMNVASLTVLLVHTVVQIVGVLGWSVACSEWA